MPAGVTAWTPLANLTLSSTQATVTFTSIAGSYRDLRLVVTGVTSGSASIITNINGDATGNYAFVSMSTNGTTGSSNSSNTGGFGWGNLSRNSGLDGRGVLTADFLDYSATDKHKVYLTRNSTSTGWVEALSGRWASNSAITQLTVTANGTTWAAGTTFALYGVSL